MITQRLVRSCILGKYAYSEKVRSEVRKWWWWNVRLNRRCSYVRNRRRSRLRGVGGVHIAVVELCTHFAGISVNRKSPFVLHEPGCKTGSNSCFGQYCSLLYPLCNRHILSHRVVFKSKVCGHWRDDQGTDVSPVHTTSTRAATATVWNVAAGGADCRSCIWLAGRAMLAPVESGHAGIRLAVQFNPAHGPEARSALLAHRHCRRGRQPGGDAG